MNRSRGTAALLAFVALAGCRNNDGGTTPPLTPTIAITASPTSLSITAGSSGQAGITLTRGGGYTGAATLTLEGVPAGVTGIFNAATIAAGATTSTLAIDVGASTAAGTYTLTVRATGSGVTAATTTVTITVAPQPSFAIGLTPPALNITQGTSGNSTVNITRTNYLGPVTLALEGAPAGITGSFNQNPSQANSSALTITVAGSVAAGAYPMTVRGTSNVLPAQTAQLTVTVLAPAGGFTISLTPNTLNVTQGQVANTTVNLNRTGGFAAEVTLSLEGAPTGVTGLFTPNPSGGASSALAVTVGAGAAPGTYNLTVRGTTPNPSPDGSLGPAAVAQMAPDETVGLTLTIAVAGNYTLTATAAAAAQGGTGTSTITINRTGGNTSTVTLALEGAPAGVTGSFLPNPATGATSTLTLTVGGAAGLGSTNVTVRGTAAGLADQTTTFQLTITGTGGFTISPSPTTVPVAPGGNGNSTITINRTGGFAGTVTFSQTTTPALPAGVTIAFNPPSTGGNTTTMNVAVANGVAVGSYTITVRANAPGQTEQTTNVALNIQSTGGGTVNWTFCTQSGIPVWAAYQNGTGGAWTQAVGVAGTFSFNITDPKGGIAWVWLNGDKAETQIIYGSVQELQNNAPACVGDGSTKTVNATMANLQAGQTSIVTLGGGSQSVNTVTQANFAIAGVPDGAVDLFATNYTQTFFPVSQTVNGIIVRRGLQPAAGSTLAPTLDWNGAEKITPITRNLTVTNGTGSLQAAVTYQTANGTGALLGFISKAAAYMFYGMPEVSRDPGDLHILTVSTSPQSPFEYRSVSRILAEAVDQTLTLGSPAPFGTFNSATTVPYLRPRIAFTNLAEYNRLLVLYWANAGGNQSSANVQIWEGYGQPLAVDYTLPDFSSVAGWSNAWGMQSGVGNTLGGYIITGWTAGGGVGMQPSAAGTTSITAGRLQTNIDP